MSKPTSYDTTPYPSQQFRQTHPLQMALPAALFGLPYAKAETARVLEMGCGEGGNLIAMAASYPDARFLGFDLAATAIETGKAFVAELGLTNIELLPLDILDAGPELGQFDYVIAHGVYSWVPGPVRDGVLKLIKQCLAPEGIAFVSYNALPGCHLRLMIREMVLHHLKGVEGFDARIKGTRDFLEFYVANAPDNDLTSANIKAFCTATLKRDPRVLFHDELGEVYHPLYLHEFTGEAAQHGLSLLGESEGPWWREEFFPSSVGKAVIGKVGADPLAIHQYLDFLYARTFRQSLLVHAERPVDRTPDYRRIRQLWISGDISCPEAEPDLHSSAEVSFKFFSGAVISIDMPVLKQAMFAIAQAHPGAVAVDTLPDHPDVHEGLLQLFTAGHLELSAGSPPAAETAGDRPEASLLARLQIARGADILCTLEHRMVAFEDPRSRAFLSRLDGSRTREELADTLLGEVPDKAAALRLVDVQLRRLARLALLVR